MNKQKIFIILSVLVLASIWWFYSQNDERKIRKMLETIETTISSNEQTSVPATLQKVKKMGKYFYPTAKILIEEPGYSTFQLESRREIEQQLMFALQNQYEIKNTDTNIQSLKITSPTAVVEINVSVQHPTYSNFQFLLEIQLKKEKRTWFINHIQNKKI